MRAEAMTQEEFDEVDVYVVSFMYDYATIVVGSNLAKDYEHAIEEAKYWMNMSGINPEGLPKSTTVKKVEKDGEIE